MQHVPLRNRKVRLTFFNLAPHLSRGVHKKALRLRTTGAVVLIAMILLHHGDILFFQYLAPKSLVLVSVGHVT